VGSIATDEEPNEQTPTPTIPTETPQPPQAELSFARITPYDNYITIEVEGGAEGDLYEYFISRTPEDLWDNPDWATVLTNTTHTFGVNQHGYSPPLMTNTRYYIGVINRGQEGLPTDTVQSYISAQVYTTRLQNLQHYAVYGRRSVSMPDHEEIPENTHDTVHFRVRFFPNDDFLARFDVNNDGVVNQDDVIALQQAIEGTFEILNPITQVEYTGISAQTVDVIRGDINKDGVINEDDIERLQAIIDAESAGGVRFNLYYKRDADAENFDLEYILQTVTLDVIPCLTQETVIDHSFTGLEANEEYFISIFSLQQAHYDQPWDKRHLVTRTAQATP
jgi:hypothetical protein